MPTSAIVILAASGLVLLLGVPAANWLGGLSNASFRRATPLLAVLFLGALATADLIAKAIESHG